MTTTMRSRKDFQEKYVYPLEPEHDFQLHGKPAEWASGHPKEWGHETESFEVSNNPIDGVERIYTNIHSAVSDDLKLLAISLEKHERILIYDIDSKELRQELEGTGKVFFRPSPKKIEETVYEAIDSSGSPAYTLISSVSYDVHRGTTENMLVLWELDKHGRLLDEEEQVDTSAFATKAIEGILPELEEKHEWPKAFVASSTLHSQFEEALSKIAAEHRRRHNTTLKNARMGNFGAFPFSSDRKLLLYHHQNTTTQHGMREPEKLPQTVVWDIEAGKEALRLCGHTDAIMWSSFSPNNQHVASVSWDGTMRMYSATDGSLAWDTENSGGQSWAGAFSPDSRHVVWSSNKGRVIQVLNVADGHLESTFPESFTEWCRCLAWHPDGQQLALCAGPKAYVWRPFNGSISQHFELKSDEEWRRFAAITAVKWIENGSKLRVSSSDGTRLVWDSRTNAKELFKRPLGARAAWSENGFYPISEGDRQFYISVDGDGKVRYWRTSFPASPSWWEKKEDASQKKKYPETGKYVKITKHVRSKEDKEDTARDAWAEKGAGLWTAECGLH